MKQNENNEQWLDEIRQTMTDYQEELPADGWEKLVAAMEEAAEEVQPEEKPLSKIVPMWVRRAAAVVLLGAVGAGGMYYFTEVTESEEVSMQTESIERQEPLAEVNGTAEDIKVGKSNETLQSKPVKVHRNRVQSSAVLASTIVPAEKESQAAEPEKDVPQKEEVVVEKQKPAEATSEKMISDIHQEETAVLLAMETTAGSNHASNRSWNVGVRLGRHGMTDFGNGGAEELLGNQIPSDTTSHSATLQTETRALTRAAQPEDMVVSSDHHLSWSAGISVSKQLHKLVAFESGLVYTYLSSDVNMSRTGQQHQQLHYLGIPLKLNVTLAESTRWQFYTGFGTMIEHSLYGKRGNMNLHLKDWQWSVNGGLGVQYKLTGHVGLYFEPGVNYFFCNGSEVPSLRTESPFSGNLQIGVRFGL